VTPITLGASATSGLAVSYQVTSGPASVTGSTLTITGAGSVTVRATQAGDTDWLAATPVSVTFTVNKAALSIRANDDSKTYGQTRSYGGGSTAFTSTGLLNGESIGTVTIAASGGTAATAAVGPYTLTPSAATGGTFSAGNYNITYNTGTLTVAAAALTIRANDDTKTYGQTRSYGAGSAAFTPTGLQNGETIGSVTITASGGTAATGGTFNAGNYTIAYNTGTLTVTQAAASVTPTAANTTYGTADPR